MVRWGRGGRGSRSGGGSGRGDIGGHVGGGGSDNGGGGGRGGGDGVEGRGRHGGDGLRGGGRCEGDGGRHRGDRGRGRRGGDAVEDEDAGNMEMPLNVNTQQMRSLLETLVSNGIEIPHEWRFLAPEEGRSISVERPANIGASHADIVQTQANQEQPQQESNTHQCLQLLNDNMTFAHQGNVSGTITKVFKSYSALREYRWSYMAPHEQEYIFDSVLNSYHIPRHLSKEFFRKPFVKLAESRISDAIYRARKQAEKNIGSETDFELLKTVPPAWCVAERWSSYCDIFASEAFQKRSKAGKINRTKQEVRSTSGSKSHAQVRYEMSISAGREVKFKEWYTKTHQKAGNVWSTPKSGMLYDQYNELEKKKFGETPEEELPPFVPELWKKVLDDREVGPSRKKALGGLHYRFAEQTQGASGSSENVYAAPASYCSQSTPSSQHGVSKEDFLQLSQSITQSFDKWGNTLTALTKRMDQWERVHDYPPPRPHPGSTRMSVPGDDEEVSDDENEVDDDEDEDEEIPRPFVERLNVGNNHRARRRHHQSSPPARSAKGKEKQVFERRRR